jgi:hypothetical protein
MTLAATQPLASAPHRVRAAAAWIGSVRRLGIVIAGIVITQLILYAPSLAGLRYMMPLRILSESPVYTPVYPGAQRLIPHDYVLTDLTFFAEPERVFVNSELRAGRLPTWTPYRFAGAPTWPLGLSPQWWPAYLIRSPVVLAYTQLLVALTAGLGAYVFFRRVLKASFWPATIAAWCYPLTGAYILWVGFWLPAVMSWLPWCLLAVDSCVRKPLGWGGPALAMFTTFCLVGGALDVAGQVLLACGVYGVWCLFDEYGVRLLRRQPMLAAGTMTLGWLLGFAAAACILLPLLEYTSTGVRMMAREHGREERPPKGIVELPEFVLPDMYGSTMYGSFRILANAYPESAAGGYAGLFATLLVAPLALCRKGRRSFNILWVILIFISVSWTLNVPGMVWLLRRPGMNMMSHNRFVFVYAFAVIALCATGLDALWRGHVLPERKWYFIPMIILLELLGWCIYRGSVLPEPIRTQLAAAVRQGQITASVRSLQDVALVQHGFAKSYLIAGGLALLTLCAWIVIWSWPKPGKWFVTAVAGVMLADLLWFGFGRAPQSRPSLYFPPVPLLQRLASQPPGRIVGFDCLPANLAQVVGLPDIRGYDGVDPSRLMDLLKPLTSTKSLVYPHAMVQWFTPWVTIYPNGGVRLAPILDMLNVRYIIFRGQPYGAGKPDFVETDYWAMTNSHALPRAFVPARVETVPDDAERLRRMLSNDYDPAQVAFVEQPLNLPENPHGEASIIRDLPTDVTVHVKMSAPGLLVLADRWDVGWRATLNGAPVPIVRTNHAVRGVVAPAGISTVEFRYDPASFRIGLVLSILALLAGMTWGCGILLWRQKLQPRG